MFAEPEVLFGNLDELCCVRKRMIMIVMTMTTKMAMTMMITMMMTILCPQVTYAFCKEFASLLSELVTSEGDLPVVKILTTIFEQVDDDRDDRIFDDVRCCC